MNNSELEIEFLGTGTSTGVPSIGCHCKVCRSKDKKDKRLRASAIVRYKGMNILITAVQISDSKFCERHQTLSTLCS